MNQEVATKNKACMHTIGLLMHAFLQVHILFKHQHKLRPQAVAGVRLRLMPVCATGHLLHAADVLMRVTVPLSGDWTPYIPPYYPARPCPKYHY